MGSLSLPFLSALTSWILYRPQARVRTTAFLTFFQLHLRVYPLYGNPTVCLVRLRPLSYYASEGNNGDFYVLRVWNSCSQMTKNRIFEYI